MRGNNAEETLKRGETPLPNSNDVFSPIRLGLKDEVSATSSL